MLTIPLKLYNQTNEEILLLQKMQQQYSYALRIVYNNLDLTVDKDFIKEIREKYNLSAKLFEYIVADATTWYKKKETQREGIQKTIDGLKKEIKTCKKDKKQKINKRINRLASSIKKNICFGGRKLAIDLSKNPKNELLRKEWKKRRNYFMLIQGEAATKGSRFFNFKGLSNGEIVFKTQDIKMPLHFKTFGKKRKKLLEKLEFLALNKKIPLSVKLSKDKIQISYDEQIVHNTKFDIKKIYKEISHIKDKEERKNILRQKHKEHEKYLFSDKNENRYCSLDLNPDGIGLIILDKKSNDPNGDYKILHKEYVSFELLNKKLKLASTNVKQKHQNNKRKYELTVSVKYIFSLMKHYHVSHFVTEQLNFNDTDIGNKEVNRKVNNLWNRTLLAQLFQKYVNINGLKWIEVIPAYSSFIGNVMHDEYDPVAAAIEIGRRGIIKYIKKSSICPSYDNSFCINGLVKRLGLSKKMYDNLNDCFTWKEVYDLFSTAKKSVRRKLSDISIDNFSGNFLGNKKSQVKYYVFN